MENFYQYFEKTFQILFEALFFKWHILYPAQSFNVHLKKKREMVGFDWKYAKIIIS